MKRISIAAMSTLSGLVLMFSYHTSRNEAAASAETALPATVQSETSASGASAADQSAATDSESESESDSESESESESESAGTATSAAAASPSKAAGSTAGSSTKTYLGQAVNTRYGPVQVQIEVKGGKITSANVTQIPWNNGRDQQINGYAVPILNKSAVAAQGTDFDSISGATFTTQGYKTSLQSALDMAGI